MTDRNEAEARHLRIMGELEAMDEEGDAFHYMAELLGWAYGKCMAFGLHNSSNFETVLKMDEIKLCLTNLRRGAHSASTEPK